MCHFATVKNMKFVRVHVYYFDILPPQFLLKIKLVPCDCQYLTPGILCDLLQEHSTNLCPQWKKC